MVGPSPLTEPSLRSTGTEAAQPASRPRWSRARASLNDPERRPALLRGAGLVALLLASTVLYLWNLTESGWANSFYAAAAQAGSESWKAFFFGSSDASNAITVDKTPLSLWPMALSIRIFGLSSASVLVPQALMGTASVALVYAFARRAGGSYAAGLGAGAVLALTPVAALMFRFNNPDALLALLLTAACYATLRALGSERALRWLIFAGALVGLAFLTKMLQAFLVLPALAITYALFAVGVSWLRRIGRLLAAFAAMVVAGGWWVLIVELWPADSRPYIGGSTNNSVLELTLGYNGLGRLNGEETGSVGGQNGWGQTGILRMFTSDIADQISWLLPAAIILGVAACWFTTSRITRAALTMMLLSLGVTATVFSLMAGIFHEYYTVALAPPIAVLVALGATVLWRARESLIASGLLALSLALTATWAFVVLDPGWHGWLRWVVLSTGLALALLIGVARHLGRPATYAVATAAVITALAAPTAYTLATIDTAHTGSIVTAGPSDTSGGTAAGMVGGGPGGGAGFGTQGAQGTPGTPGNQGNQGTGGNGGAQGNVGGLLEGSESTEAITALLRTDADSYDWVAAAVGSNTASGYQLATEEPVMAIGGFNGTDSSPTLEQFQTYVEQGRIHYFIAGGGGMSGGNDENSTSSQITSWVEQNFEATTVDGVRFYDLSGD